MSDILIEATEVARSTVYGVKQYVYTVEGVPNQDFSSALAVASLYEATALEQATISYVDMTREREKKVSDLGEVLSTLSRVIALMPVKNQTQGDTVSDSSLVTAYDLCTKYNIDPTQWGWYRTGTITRAACMRSQNGIQYELDREDNDLQQDMVAVQSLVSKRDTAYSTAAKIVKKALKAADSVISQMG